MSRAVPRRVVMALLLTLLAWILVRWTEFRTQLEIQSDESGSRLIVNGQALEVPGRIGHLRAFEIVPSGGFDALGAGPVRILGPKDEAEEYPMPKRFRFGAPGVPYTSDWWVDYGRTGPDEIIRQHTSMPEPWSLKVTFFGRGRSFVIVEGDRELVFGFRAGAIDNDMFVTARNGPRIGGGTLVPNTRLDLRHLLHWPAAGLFMAGVLILLFEGVSRLGRRWRWQPRRMRSWPIVISVLLTIFFALSVWMAYTILDARPHFQDDLGYLLRAKWLLAGQISLPKPEPAASFNVPFTLFVKDRWISMYPVGWPLLLAAAQGVNAAWLAAPVCGLIAAFATWKIGQGSGGSVVGAMAVVFLILSPLNLVLAGSMLSHAAAQMWLALFIWLFLRGWKGERGWRSLALAGVALGAAFATRPLSGVAVGAAAGIFLVFELIRRRGSSPAWLGVLAFVVGGLLGSLPALVDNWLTTGNPLKFAYSLAILDVWTPSAYGPGLFYVERLVGQIPALGFDWGWPWTGGACWPLLALTFAFASVPFLLGRASRADWLLLGVIIALLLSYVGSNAGSGLHGFGPRYFADVFFALALLTARGFQELARAGDAIRPSVAPRYLAAFLFLVLAGGSAVSLHYRMGLYRSYNGVDGTLEVAIASQKLTKGLVLLGNPVYLNWVRAARLLPVDVRSNLVFAASGPDNERLLRAYEGWPVYLFDGDGLRPYVKDTP